MSFYNHRTSISNTTNSISPFYFDKIYTSRKQMDDNCANDGVYLGRFVLVKYGEDDGVGGHQITLNNNNFSETLGVTWTNNFWDDAIKYWDIQRQGGNLNINVLGYDNTVWQKNLVDGKMKYIMVSSLYAPEIDMTANVLNGELIGGKGIEIDQVPEPGTPSDVGYNYKYTFNIDLANKSGLEISNGASGGLKVREGAGLELSDGSGVLQVKPKTEKVSGQTMNVSGLTVDGWGVNIDLAPNSGLEIKGSNENDAIDGGLKVRAGDGLEVDDNNNLKVKPKTETISGEEVNTSGLTVDSSGVSIDLAYYSGLTRGRHGLSINPGAGLSFTDNNQLKVFTDLKGGLAADSNGLKVNINKNLYFDTSGKLNASRLSSVSGAGLILEPDGNDYKLVQIGDITGDVPLTQGTHYIVNYYNHFEAQDNALGLTLTLTGDKVILMSKALPQFSNTNFTSDHEDYHQLNTESDGFYIDGFQFGHGVKKGAQKYYLQDYYKTDHSIGNDNNRNKWYFNYPQSLILGFRFVTNKTVSLAGNTIDLSKLNTKTAKDIIVNGDSLWNVAGSPKGIFVRASWRATSSVSHYITGYNPNDDTYNYGFSGDNVTNYFFWVGASYADGYNRNFNIYRRSDAGNATKLIGTTLNMWQFSMEYKLSDIIKT